FEKGGVIVARGSDVQDDQFIGAFRVVARGKFHGIARIAQSFEVHAFHDADAVGIQAGNNAMRQAHAGSLKKFSRSFAPGAPLFSGWNCTPRILRCSTTAMNARPCSQTAMLSGPEAGAAYECAK